MTDTADHPVTAVDLEDGVPTEPVSLDVVRSGLDSEDNRVRSRAATVAAGIARTDSERSVDLAPALRDAIRDDHRVVVTKSAAALSVVAEEDPERVAPATDRLVDLLDHDVAAVRTLSARALSHVALDDPGALVEHVDALVAAAAREPEDVVDDRTVAAADYDDQARTLHLVNAEHVTEQVRARETAAHLLVEAAERDPAAVKPRVSTLVDLLSDRDAAVVAAAADVLGTVAEDDPAAVADAVGPLCDLLGHPDDDIAAAAVAALGFAGDPAAVDPLRALAADDDRDEDLRALASETADFLASEE